MNSIGIRAGRIFLTLAAVGAISECAALGSTGSDVFEANCMACHGRDGKAKTPAGKMLGARDLTVTKMSDADIRKQVSEGFKNAGGVQMMPGFKGTLSPEQIEAVMDFVKSLQKK